MIFHLIAKIAFEPWDWRNGYTGIGCSELSQIQMAKGLAKVGHEVHSYGPIPDDCPTPWEGTHWHKLEDFDPHSKGVIVIYRVPEMIDDFDTSSPDRVFWLVAQDWDYEKLSPERLDRFDRIVVLCEAHRDYMVAKNPALRKKIWITRNCTTLEHIQTVEAAGLPKRKPFQMMYASSPDRGLKSSLQVFRRVKNYIPEASLVCTYGYNNMDKLIAQGLASSHRPTKQRALEFQRDKDECMRLVAETGAQFIGRVPQPELLRLWAESNVLIYITDFFETGWATGWDAQAMGAIPVFSPIFAQGNHTKFGIPVTGDPKDPQTIERAAAEIVNLMHNPELQESIRKPMMEHARKGWVWEVYVDQKPKENWVDAATEDFDIKKARLASSPWPADSFRLPDGMTDNPDEAWSRERWLHLAPGTTFLDIGAADGAWSIAAAKQGATVYAIDPVVSYTKLPENVDKNGVCDLITLVPMFVGHAPGVVKLSQGSERREVPCMTLDSWLLTQTQIERVDFIKIDVEGDELQVLRGALGTLRRWLPKLVIEVHGNLVPGKKVPLKDVANWLKDMVPDYRQEVADLYDPEGRPYWHLYASAPSVD